MNEAKRAPTVRPRVAAAALSQIVSYFAHGAPVRQLRRAYVEDVRALQGRGVLRAGVPEGCLEGAQGELPAGADPVRGRCGKAWMDGPRVSRGLRLDLEQCVSAPTRVIPKIATPQSRSCRCVEAGPYRVRSPRQKDASLLQILRLLQSRKSAKVREFFGKTRPTTVHRTASVTNEISGLVEDLLRISS